MTVTTVGESPASGRARVCARVSQPRTTGEERGSVPPCQRAQASKYSSRVR